MATQEETKRKGHQIEAGCDEPAVSGTVKQAVDPCGCRGLLVVHVQMRPGNEYRSGLNDLLEGLRVEIAGSAKPHRASYTFPNATTALVPGSKRLHHEAVPVIESKTISDSHHELRFSNLPADEYTIWVASPPGLIV